VKIPPSNLKPDYTQRAGAFAAQLEDGLVDAGQSERAHGRPRRDVAWSFECVKRLAACLAVAGVDEDSRSPSGAALLAVAGSYCRTMGEFAADPAATDLAPGAGVIRRATHDQNERDFRALRAATSRVLSTVRWPMSIVWASVVVIAAMTCAIAAMLLVRRRAPQGSYFEDGDRAAGVFGVLATGFAVLAGFVVFLAFESFDTSRSGAEAEARIVAEQFETVQFLPAPAPERLSGELVCYARSVVHQEWPRMTSGTLGNALNPWGVALFRGLRATEPRSASAQAAFSKYLDQRSDREDARADRTHGAEGVIPTPLWIVLFLSAGTLFVFMLFFADSGERVVVQATMMGGVALVVTSLLLLLWFLDNPYHGGVGALRPVAMERTLDLLKEEADIVGGVKLPCDEAGSRSG
jgi:hypothetical protein